MIEELQLRNYSASTIHSYVTAVWRFTRHFHKSPELLGPEDVRQYLLHLRNVKKRAFNTLQVNRAALRFLYVRVLKRGWFDEEIPAPKKRPLPITVMTAEQITRILDRTHNLSPFPSASQAHAFVARRSRSRFRGGGVSRGS